MLTRRRFLHLAGLGGLTLTGAPLWSGCSSGAPVPAPGPAVEPLPDDPSKPWWLRQDYAPVEESEAFDLPIVGAIPAALSGLYLRNGPNPSAGDSGHWFIGDGMVHGVLLDNGKAPWYRARYVQTSVLGGGSGSGPPGLTEHQANTSILGFRDRVLCLEEVGLPYEIRREDLSTVGPYDFAGALATSMTAHPKVDPVTGELLFFGYGVLDPAITYHRVDPSGVLVQSERVPLPMAVMMHDFQVTESHIVFMDLPIIFDLGLALEGDPFPYRWAPENGARLGVMPRAGTAMDVKWIQIDPCYVFHTWNAFHDAGNPDVIHLDCMRYATMWEMGSTDFSADGSAHRFSIDLVSSSVSLTQLDDRYVEFPRISPRRQGRAYRYGYGVSGPSPAESGALAPFNQIVKYDWQTGQLAAHALPAGQEADEAAFVPDPQGTAEDDGWLLSYVFDHADNKSHLLVLDATDVAGPPVAQVELPVRVPHGFHGDFLLSGA